MSDERALTELIEEIVDKGATTVEEIHRAIAADDQEIVAELLTKDPGLALAPDDNETRDLPLHTAAIHGRIELARILLDAGAEIDGGDILVEVD